MGLFMFQNKEAKFIVDITDSVGKWKTSWFLFKGHNFFLMALDSFLFYPFSINLPCQRYEGHLSGLIHCVITQQSLL